MSKKIVNTNILQNQKSLSERGVKPTDDKTTSRWWWFIIQFNTDEGALSWSVPTTPKIKFSCWRPHKAPTTGQAHVHCLIEYCSPQPYKTLKNKGYLNLKYCSETVYQTNCREYCLADTKTKNGTTVWKNPIGPYQQYGEYKVKTQGVRDDLITGKKRIWEQSSWIACIRDDDLTPIIAKYGKWAKDMYDNRPVPPRRFRLPCGLQEYQDKVIEILRMDPVRRLIIWIWSTAHGTGKSTFYDWLRGFPDIIKNKRILCGDPDKKRTLYAYDGHDIIWFDISKTSEFKNEKFERLRDSTIEPLSNQGYQLSTMICPVEKLIKCHVVVTSNERPPNEALPNRLLSIEAKTPIIREVPSKYEPDYEDDVPDAEIEIGDMLRMFSESPEPTPINTSITTARVGMRKMLRQEYVLQREDELSEDDFWDYNINLYNNGELDRIKKLKDPEEIRLERLERLEAEKLLDDRAKQCVELLSEDELKERGIRIVK